jgi:predicted metalloprotease
VRWAMMDSQFFDESREQSQIKARIAQKYFWAWAKSHHSYC